MNIVLFQAYLPAKKPATSSSSSAPATLTSLASASNPQLKMVKVGGAKLSSDFSDAALNKLVGDYDLIQTVRVNAFSSLSLSFSLSLSLSLSFSNSLAVSLFLLLFSFLHLSVSHSLPCRLSLLTFAAVVEIGMSV